MRDGRVVLTCLAVVLATLLVGAAPARADRRMVVLIDASGSMTIPRNNADGRGANRFEAARSLATSRVQEQASVPTPEPLRVAVFTFRGTTTLIPATHAHGTTGFLDPNDALDEIEALTVAADVGGNTPLAGAMCSAIDVLADTDARTQILQVSSDGEENATPIGHPCQGTVFTGTVTDPSQYPADSYQRKVLDHITSVGSVIVRIDLFQSAQISLARGPTADPEGVLSPKVRQLITTPAATAALNPLEQFFTFVAVASGGELSVARDNEVLPVVGDLNNDRCINRADALLVARAFGPATPGTRLDLNLDRSVDITDYLLQASRIDPACGPDPFVSRPPVVCDGPRQVVIDGQAIESGAITVDVRSACQIVIKNSLIVSGQNAITINGSAVVKIDNSIVVGPNALRGTRGTVILSTANTIYHGTLSSAGALNIIDRGGNTFE